MIKVHRVNEAREMLDDEYKTRAVPLSPHRSFTAACCVG